MSRMDVDVLGGDWRKASHSVNNGQCVEVASARVTVMVRDSVSPSGPTISYPASTWRAFLASARTGAYDITR